MVQDSERKQWLLYLRSTPTEGGMRIQSYTHSLTADFMGDWAPAHPTGLNTSSDYQPDGSSLGSGGAGARQNKGGARGEGGF